MVKLVRWLHEHVTTSGPSSVVQPDLENPPYPSTRYNTQFTLKSTQLLSGLSYHFPTDPRRRRWTVNCAEKKWEVRVISRKSEQTYCCFLYLDGDTVGSESSDSGAKESGRYNHTSNVKSPKFLTYAPWLEEGVIVKQRETKSLRSTTRAIQKRSRENYGSYGARRNRVRRWRPNSAILEVCSGVCAECNPPKIIRVHLFNKEGKVFLWECSWCISCSYVYISSKFLKRWQEPVLSMWDKGRVINTNRSMIMLTYCLTGSAWLSLHSHPVDCLYHPIQYSQSNVVKVKCWGS